MATVLVVDDVNTDRRLLGNVVQEAGHVVEFASNGEEAIQKATSVKPAMIFLDVVMPKMDGFATCRTLKKNAETAAIPVVLVTSKNKDADKFWGEKQGADHYLTKPFKPQDVTGLLQKYL